MNKKGDINIVEYLVYIIFIIIAASFIAWVAFGYLNEKIDTTNLESFILAKKIVNSDSCLAFKDDLSIHKGVIDLQKVDTSRLLNCFSKPNFGYLIKIDNLKGETIKSASNLDLRQQLDFPICKTIPQYTCLSKKDIILYKDDQGIKTGYIEVGVINFVQ